MKNLLLFLNVAYNYNVLVFLVIKKLHRINLVSVIPNLKMQMRAS